MALLNEYNFKTFMPNHTVQHRNTNSKAYVCQMTKHKTMHFDKLLL